MFSQGINPELNLENVNEIIEAVCKIIEEVSFAGTDSVVPSTIEGKCVQDADRLDALGAIGVARTFAYSGAKKRPFYGEDSHSALAHFEEKLCHLSEALSTERGKGIARQRQAYLNGFLEQFMAELELNK